MGLASHRVTLHFNLVIQGSSGGGDGFEVTKFGHGRVALIGFPRCPPSSAYNLIKSSVSKLSVCTSGFMILVLFYD